MTVTATTSVLNEALKIFYAQENEHNTGHNLCDEAVVDGVTTGIIHMREGLEPQVKGCGFVEEIMTGSGVPSHQVFSGGSLGFSHSWDCLPHWASQS